jgi:hypothetical protein
MLGGLSGICADFIAIPAFTYATPQNPAGLTTMVNLEKKDILRDLPSVYVPEKTNHNKL